MHYTRLNTVTTALSFHVLTFIWAHEDNQVVVEVTGSRKLENGHELLRQ